MVLGLYGYWSGGAFWVNDRYSFEPCTKVGSQITLRRTTGTSLAAAVIYLPSLDWWEKRADSVCPLNLQNATE